MYIETILNTLPDSLAFGLVIFAGLYILYLVIALIAFSLISALHSNPFDCRRAVKLAVLPFIGTITVAHQLLLAAADVISTTALTSDDKPRDDLMDLEIQNHVDNLKLQHDTDLALTDEQFYSEGPCK